MNRFSLYILLILIFLGLSKSFSPSSQKTDFIDNERVFASYFKGAPLSIILEDTYKAGFLIKTYYFKLKVIHGFKSPEHITVRTSRKFWIDNQKNIGMSLFRRYERNSVESIVPMPPGSLYIGDPSFGHWEYLDSGEKGWKFHRAYKKFPILFQWHDFIPNYKFFQTMKVYLESEQAFYGVNTEFGTLGSITKLSYQEKNSESQLKKESFKIIYKKLLSTPPWEKK